MVVAVGDAETEPPATGVTAPTPLSMDANVAPLFVEESVVALPT